MSGDGLGGNGTDGIWGRLLPLPCVLPGMHANPNFFVYAFRIRLLAAQVLLAHIQARWVPRQEASSALPIHLPAVAKDHPPCFRARIRAASPPPSFAIARRTHSPPMFRVQGLALGRAGPGICAGRRGGGGNSYRECLLPHPVPHRPAPQGKAGQTGWAGMLETLAVNVRMQVGLVGCLHRKCRRISSPPVPPQVGLVDCLYRKCLRISCATRTAQGAGRLVNLQSNDAAKLWGLPVYAHVLWSGPFQARGSNAP